MQLVVKKFRSGFLNSVNTGCVLDPVMISTSGHRLMDKDAEQTLQKELFPLAEIITPNIPEAEALTGLQITNADSMEEAAHKLYESFHISVLLKGGHRINDANDLLYTNGHGIWQDLRQSHWKVCSRCREYLDC